MDLLAGRSPDVDFTGGGKEAACMAAATIREQRVQGILEDVRVVDLLNEPSKK